MSRVFSSLAPLLQVYDMPTSLAFYCDALGFELISSNRTEPPFDWVLLRRDDVEVMLNTMYESDARPPAPDDARNAMHTDVTLYIGCADVDGLYAELRERAIALPPPTTAPYGMRQLGVTDPDGYGLCFQWPRPTSAT